MPERRRPGAALARVESARPLPLRRDWRPRERSAAPLPKPRVSLLAVSTHDTDYMFVRVTRSGARRPQPAPRRPRGPYLATPMSSSGSGRPRCGRWRRCWLRLIPRRPRRCRRRRRNSTCRRHRSSGMAICWSPGKSCDCPGPSSSRLMLTSPFSTRSSLVTTGSGGQVVGCSTRHRRWTSPGPTRGW